MSRSISKWISAGLVVRVILAVALFTQPCARVWAQGSDSAEGSIDLARTVVLFYSATCSHCHEEMVFLDSIDERYPALDFVQIEIDQSGNEANKAFYARVMELLDSDTGAWPRTVIGNRVFIGFDPSEGPLLWSEPFRAWIGYGNQLEAAIDELNRRAMGTEEPRAGEPGDESTGVTGSTDWNRPIRAGFAFLAALTVYGFAAFLRFRRTDARDRRLWIGGGLLVALAGLFAVAGTLPVGAIAGAVAGDSGGWPFPVMVTVIALLDGFNPCAFTVLFILLSLLTYARRRSQMILVGGVFIATSALVYALFIFAMIVIGSFTLARTGTWVLRAVGGIVLVMGVATLRDVFMHRAESRTALSAGEKARFGRKAGKIVRRFAEAQTWSARILAVGATITLAVAVNGVELGCTAILPAVYMGSLLRTYGTGLRAPHLFWTTWYAVVYVLPMGAILLDFVVTFRSRRIDERYGRVLKVAGGTVMVGFGLLMAFAPGMLVFG